MSQILDEIWKARHPYDALFLSIIEGYQIKVFPEISENIFYVKNNDILIEYDKLIQETYINYFLIWKKIHQTYESGYKFYEEIVTRLVENHLGIKNSKVVPKFL